MREIKFRAKRIFSNDWIYGNLIIDKNNKKYIVPYKYFDADGHHLSYCDETDLPVFIDENTIGQFIGVCDTNGKDIYEGDIIHFSFGIPSISVYAPVEWKVDQWVVITKGHTPSYSPLGSLKEYVGEFEVVGNIHENKEII